MTTTLSTNSTTAGTEAGSGGGGSDGSDGSDGSGDKDRKATTALAPTPAGRRRRNRTYHDDQRRYFRFLVPKGQRVLEIGCGEGDLLAAVEPREGVGIDWNPAAIEAAKRRHPHLELSRMDPEQVRFAKPFDVIMLSGVLGQLRDIQLVLERLHACCHERTRLVFSYYNYLWEPVLKLAEAVGLKSRQKTQSWLSPQDVTNLLSLAGFEVVKSERRVLLPLRIPFLTPLINSTLAFLPGLRALCLSTYVVARPTGLTTRTERSVTVLIPCRNEKGNIEDAIKRMPRFGTAQEIIFVDGHSTDGTVEEIERVIAAYPDWDIRLLVQDGVGKGDAVRKGFGEAKHDILMILDADLTVPPEDLPKFYDALRRGKGDLINGCRLIYPMEKQAMRFLNLLGNKLFALAFSWLLNQRIKDTLCGTKVLLREDYERIAANRDYFGDFDPFGDFDLLFGAAKQNLRIIELPIRYRERLYGETNISRFRHGWVLLKMAAFAFFKLKAI